MDKLEKLIAKLCPNGVEYKPLWSLTAWDKKFNAVDRAKQSKVIRYHYFLANEFEPLIVAGGSVKLLTTNESNIFTTEEKACGYISEGEIVSIPWGGNPNIQYYCGKFLTADNRIATSLDTGILSNKFLYYVMLNLREEIGSFYRGSGIKHPDMAKVLDLEIPVPPLAVQEEIVRMLDGMAGLISELEQELAARKQQYEWYRDKLLKTNDGCERVSLDEVCDFMTGFAFKASKFKEEGLPICKTTNISNGEIDFSEMACFDESDYSDDLTKFQILSGEIVIGMSGTIKVGKNKTTDCCYLNQRVGKFAPHCEVLDNDYLYFCLLALVGELSKNIAGASVINLSNSDILGLELPLPPLAEQKKIVARLEGFDKLCNSMTDGLPGEIALRKQQYEFYRDQLLTFKRAG